jgi:hypothetical protein
MVSDVLTFSVAFCHMSNSAKDTVASMISIKQK